MSDDEVFIIDSTSEDDAAPSPAVSNNQAPQHSWGGGEEAALRPRGDDGVSKYSRAVPAVCSTHVGTNTEDPVPASSAARLQRHLLMLAASMVDPSDRESQSTGDRPAAKRQRAEISPAPWEDTLRKLRRMCLESQLVPLPAFDATGDPPGHSKASVDEEPAWMSRVTALLAMDREMASPSPPQLAEERAVAQTHYALLAEPIPLEMPASASDSDGGLQHPRGGHRMRGRRSRSQSSRKETSEARESDAIAAESRFILAREGADSLLDVYGELCRLRRQNQELVGPAAVATAGVLTQQETLFHMMAEQLSKDIEREAKALRSDCGAVRGEGHRNVEELREDMNALSRLRAELEERKNAPCGSMSSSATVMRAEKEEPPSVAPPPVVEARRHGEAFAAFQAAHSQEVETLQQRIDDLSCEVQEAKLTAISWEQRYRAASKELSNREASGMETHTRQEVFRAYRDKWHGTLGFLAETLGWTIRSMDGFKATLVQTPSSSPSASSPTAGELVVNLETKEVISGGHLVQQAAAPAAVATATLTAPQPTTFSTAVAPPQHGVSAVMVAANPVDQFSAIAPAPEEDQPSPKDLPSATRTPVSLEPVGGRPLDATSEVPVGESPSTPSTVLDGEEALSDDAPTEADKSVHSNVAQEDQADSTALTVPFSHDGTTADVSEVTAAERTTAADETEAPVTAVEGDAESRSDEEAGSEQPPPASEPSPDDADPTAAPQGVFTENELWDASDE